MHLLHPPTLKQLCARAGIRPSRSAGQHFLVHGGTLGVIVAAVDPQPNATILEIGAGFGTLTTVLASRGVRVIAIERDARIVPILREQVASYPQVEVVEGDVLHILKDVGAVQRFLPLHLGGESSPQATATACCCAGRDGRGDVESARPPSPDQEGVVREQQPATEGAALSVPPPLTPPPSGSGRKGNWKLVANLPYSITSDFLRLLFDAVGTGVLPSPERVVLLLQHEVVERLLGRTPGDVGLLTMIAQLHCARIHRIAKVPASHFWPQPKVSSAVVVLEGWRTPEEILEMLGSVAGVHLISPPPSWRGRSRGGGVHAASSQHTITRKQFLEIMARGFSHPRRQIQNNIERSPAAWVAARVDPTARPATLTLEQWMALACVDR